MSVYVQFEPKPIFLLKNKICVCYNEIRYLEENQMKKFFKEFKAFISKGNVFDMAVGLIIATAFNKIVSSMVNDIIMPLVTWATGAKNLADLSIVLRETVEADGTITKLTWQYGNFLQAVIDFLIIAFSVFVMDCSESAAKSSAAIDLALSII